MRTLPRRRSTLKVVALSVLASLALLAAVPVFADEPSGAQVAAMGAVFLVMFVVAAAFYIYLALALQTIAKKTNTENAWWAWIPIIQHDPDVEYRQEAGLVDHPVASFRS